jgi:adenylate cyclase
MRARRVVARKRRIMSKWERQLRLWTGLVLAGFIVVHLSNHALGVVSIDAMDRMLRVVSGAWQHPLGSVLLYGALLVHFALALVSLYRRTTLRMPLWEALQLGFGLSVPPLLIAHVVGTRLAFEFLGHQVDYVRVIAVLWSDPWLALRQSILLLVVWTHLCFGIHFWLRVQTWYPRVQPILFALALLVPALALSGFVAAGFALGPIVERMGGLMMFNVDLASMTPADRALLGDWREGLLWAFWFALGSTLLARSLRSRIGPTYQIHHPSGRVIRAPVGRSILEAVRAAGLPHASVCGGRARCTTCRVRIGRGLEALPAPSALEAGALARIGAEPNVRLACQTRPREAVSITPLVRAGSGHAIARRPGGVQGGEREVVALFVDLRDSTRLGETRLPYDVVFILNQFFAEMFAALQSTDGYYAQFRGDGLLALYGLHTDLATACRQAIDGAIEMQARIERLSETLASELNEALRIGIGVHSGVAIVGTMGPPDAPIYSAIGDTINIAARLESMSKRYRCTLVVSHQTLQRAGAVPADLAPRSIRVRGRAEPIEICAIEDLQVLARSAAPHAGRGA